MKITSKRGQRQARLILPSVSNLRDAGAKTKNLTIAAIAVLLLFFSCDVKDPVYETDHPDKARITVTTDWSDIGIGITKPAFYQVAYGSEKLTANVDRYTFPNLLAPGSYTLYFYNEVAEIPVTGTDAKVKTIAAPDGAMGTFVEPNPNWLFTSKLTAAVEKDTHHEFTAAMRQEVMELTFTVTPTGSTADKIASITATLGGVAGAMGMDNRVRSEASKIAMTFTEQADGKWKATVRLLGIVGNEQPLTTTVKFIDGNPNDVEDTTDIHDKIEDNFDPDGGPVEPGSGGNQPDIDLGTEIVDTPVGTGFTATIKPWEKITGSGTAD